jgi:hypothetical protein
MASRLCAVGDVAYIDRLLYAFHQHGTNLHFRHQAPVMRDEILPMIDEVFDGPLAARMAEPEKSRRRIVRNALVHLPTMYIFSGAELAGWRMYWESVKIKPFDTIMQRRTLALLARTMLGGRAYGWIRQRLSRGRPVFSGAPLDVTPQAVQR